MAYSYDPLFAADPSNAANVAANASIIIFDPNDPGKAPVTITDVTGSPLPNPITVNKNGFGPAFQHATLDRVGWFGAGFTGYFTSYEGMKAEAVAAKDAAQDAAVTAGAAAEAELTARIEAGEFTGAPGVDGGNVLPTQQAIEQALINPGPAKTALTESISEQVPGFVTAAIAGGSTVADAAAAAVNATLTDAHFGKLAAAEPDKLAAGAITYTPAGAETGFAVEWPDGVTGTYAGTPSVTFPSAIDSYTVSRNTTPKKEYRQPKVTRDTNGRVINRPPLNVVTFDGTKHLHYVAADNSGADLALVNSWPAAAFSEKLVALTPLTTNPPVIDRAALNGQDAVLFAKTSPADRLGTPSWGTALSVFTLAVVFKSSSTATGIIAASADSWPLTAGNFVLQRSLGDVAIRTHNGTSAVEIHRVPANDLNLHVAVVVFDGASSKFYLNGARSNGTLAPVSVSRLTIGDAPAGPGPFKGLIPEISVASRALTETEVQDMTTALLAKYTGA